MDTNKKLSLFAVIAVLGAGVVFYFADDKTGSQDSAVVSVTVPQLSFAATAGKKVFDTNCARCHGVNAAGTDKGPPFIHTIYNPGHHSDEAFYRAPRQGVPGHHWRYGNMPPLPDVSKSQIRFIIRYVRELQLANGIDYKKHTM